MDFLRHALDGHLRLRDSVDTPHSAERVDAERSEPAGEPAGKYRRGGDVGRDDLLGIFWICARKRVNMHRFKREILPVSGYAARHFVCDMRRALARAVLSV